MVQQGDVTTHGTLAGLTADVQLVEAFYLTWRQECLSATVLARRNKLGGQKPARGPAPPKFPFSAVQTGSQEGPGQLKLVSNVAMHGVIGHDQDIPKDDFPKEAKR